jgi:single-stranded DNA-specific DHH superfamily exonuclease
MQIEEFNQKVNKAIGELKAAKPKEAIVIHHDNADGLCSAAITKKVFSSKNWKCQSFAKEKAL